MMTYTRKTEGMENKGLINPLIATIHLRVDSLIQLVRERPVPIKTLAIKIFAMEHLKCIVF